MPLPLFIGIAVTTSGIGIKNTVQAGLNANNASKINQSAQELVDESSKTLDVQKQACGKALGRLGEEKLFVLNNSMNEFIEAFAQIKNVDFRDSIGLEELKNFHIDSKEFADMKTMVNFAGSIVGGVTAGTASGALVAFGAYSSAKIFATASTGTAIASLSGAAARNATLAFFGGGSLAAGGLGMTGGMYVLGGLVAGPALMVMGFVTSTAAKKNLENAYINQEEANQINEQLSAASLQCESIRRRSYMYYNLLARLDAYFLPLIYRMEDILKNEGNDYRNYSSESKKIIASCASFAVTIKSLLDTPILTEAGSLTEESETTIKNVQAKLGKATGTI
ncbi:hypothetical protein [Catenisphaera adipataccumulans]|uniref:Uncharacterized protein n=1 Tax=Catenisphaera adipataccumulans TaxID=700500 RepID=A0A7W8CW28_9FIRM|nr:hypothetical protein [Catenisphaera adipataccumulans]MBB5182676.1 hypothetical protein [Catenisphaera adipataccumulans]